MANANFVPPEGQLPGDFREEHCGYQDQELAPVATTRPHAVLAVPGLPCTPLSPRPPPPPCLCCAAGAPEPLGERITAIQRGQAGLSRNENHPPPNYSAVRPTPAFTDKCSDPHDHQWLRQWEAPARRKTSKHKSGLRGTLHCGWETEWETTCSMFPRDPNPTMLSAAAEKLSRNGLGKDSEGREAKWKACSYPLLTPELCIPEVLVLSPFAMGEADTEE